MRGRLLLGIAAAAALASCAGAPPPGRVGQAGTWTGAEVVVTRFGAVRGFPDRDDTLVWKAIPFAAPPVGDLRWRAPRDPAPWAGALDRRSFSAGCTQFTSMIRGSMAGSEDCLYLNVWRPRGPETGLPVYVWIHGGGNSTGSAAMVPDYHGNRVAARDRMVFVSINYRLGPFGWFTHPALRDGEPALDASGNYGTLDIIKALGWIQDNIAAFGGDPSRVMITGESAGGFNVLSLLLSPQAHGLFAAALSQSGSAMTRGMDEADARSGSVLAALLVRAGRARTEAAAREAAARMSAREAAAFLRSRTDRQLLGCYDPGAAGMIDNPAILRDGAVIPAEGFDALAAGSHPNKVPVILGGNKEEVKLFLSFGRTPPWRSDLYQAVARYSSMRWKVSGVDEPARRLSSHPDQPPVYAYLFSWGAPDATGASVLPGTWGRRLGAFHGLDITFFLGQDTVFGLFQSVIFTSGNAPGRKALSSAMMDYVAWFARTGDPNRPGSGLPRWEPWTNVPGAPRYIVFDAAHGSPEISMSAEELTDQGVMDAMDAELPEPLRTQAREYIDRFKMPSAVR
jgi:para-nitrobenzyl esterase